MCLTSATASPCARRTFASIAAFVAAVTCLGCEMVRPHEYVLHVEGASGAEARRFVLLPLNLVVRMPVELESGADRVEQEVERYLESRGKSVQTLSLISARSRWEQSTGQVEPSAENRFQAAAGIFVRSLEGLEPFDAVILPSLVLRSSTSRRGKVRWDGVSRKELRTGHPPAGFSGTPEGVDPAGVQVNSASLHVFLISPEGQIIFESYGGLDILSKVVWDPSGRYHRELLDDPLSNRAHVREGVVVAFDPYLPRRP